MQRWILVKQEVSGEQVGVGHECGWSKRGVCGPWCLGQVCRGSDGNGRVFHLHVWETGAYGYIWGNSDVEGIRMNVRGVVWGECVRRLQASEGCFLGVHVVWGKLPWDMSVHRWGLGLPGWVCVAGDLGIEYAGLGGTGGVWTKHHWGWLCWGGMGG